MRTDLLRLSLAALLAVTSLRLARAQSPLHLYATGSLTNAMTELLAQSGLSVP